MGGRPQLAQRSFVKRPPDRDKTREFYVQEGPPDGVLGRLAHGRGLGLRRAVLGLEGLRDAMLGGITGKMLLELGAGYGGELVEFTLSGARAVGVDFALTRLLQIPRKAEEAATSVAVVAGDCHRLPFPDHSFDIVYGSAILAHLDRERAFAEAQRVLRPGGRLILVEPLDRHPLLRLYRRWLKTREDVVSYLDYAELDADRLGGGYELRPAGLTSASLLPLAAAGVDGAFWRGAARLLNRLDALLFTKSLWARRHAWVCLARYRGKNLER
jgi:SAM-dependent methyltransferase